ncbi:hypothetical protein EB796_013691 [Bugula neritina]|uniref:Rho-GAP domain-containing protein n=1 Tax=Bugula neritina TaxID=10212 RepID=A0A7J7JRE2_BUGNE|nr:hypothetical protein EB796_013691 [Bugula neritina]
MQKNRNGLVFGVPLSSMDSIEDPNIGHVPKFLANIRQYLSAHLDKEGLFRKTGSVARQKDLVQYIEESEGKIREGSQVYDVTSVIKQFFRELPEPLIPYILQEAFVQAAQLSSADSKIYSLNLLCLLLPPSHLSVFRYVLEILSDVSSNWQVNKMTAHNIAVCLTPNLYHSKPNCKHIQLQTETVEICIDNVINIGVVPPSIMEKVVMLKSLEDHQLSNSSALDQSAGSGSVSLRRKKRSGSLQGLVGSIRRSVSKLKNKTSRRSSSVPTDLDKLQHVFDDAMPQHVPSGAADGKTDSVNCATPLIMHRVQERDCVGIFADKRRAMMGRSGLQGLPPLGINVSSQDSVITYDSICQPTHINELSLNSPKTDASRITTPTKRSSWGGLRSPFSKRKRSASAGPTFSPNASKLSKSSSKTKKLIRRLSGGKRKTPDMIGQRLAFDNEDDVADVRQRMPSAPPAFRINSDFGVGDNVECEELSPRGGEQELKVEHVSRSRSKRSRSVRARARSADTRHILRRGRPNHPTAGLTKARLQALEASTPRNSASSLQSYIEHDAIIAAGVDPLPQSTEPKEAQDWVECGVAEPVYKNVKRHRQHLVREDSFDTRMQVVAGAHSSLFKDLTHDKPVLRASTSSVSGGATGKPPRPEKTISVKKQSSDAKLTLTRASATTLESAEATTRCLSKLEGSSPVSNLETEAGLSTSVSEELTWNDPVSAECRYDKVMDTTSEQPNVSQKALHKLV